MSIDDSGNLVIGGVLARDLIAEFGSPLYVMSEHTLRMNYRRILRAFQERWPSRVVILYAIKANNNLAVRAILHQEGAGGDCFGGGELYATFMGGADPARVLMNGSNKSDEDLAAAVRLGIGINIDAEDEIARLEGITASLGQRARVNLRVKVVFEELDKFEPDYVSMRPTARLSNVVAGKQWGYSAGSLVSLIPIIQNSPQFVLEGYHFHLGRVTRELSFYRAWAEALGKTVVNLHNRTGFVPRTLDVGGGYPRERDPESQRLEVNPWQIEDYADTIVGGLEVSLREGDFPVPELWIEPGRYIVGNAGILLGTVGSIKRDLGRTWVNVDFSINNLMRAESHHSAHHVVSATRVLEGHTESVDIVGGLCTGIPIARARSMPKLERGDLLAVLDAGMYAETASTQFNGVPRPATVLVNEGVAEIIKERESVLDVFSKHRIPARLRIAPRVSMGREE